jgi:hypothetical protein
MRSIRFPTTAFARVTTVFVAANMCVSLGGALVSGSTPAGRVWHASALAVGNLPCQTIQY